MTLYFVTDRADAHVARFDALFRTLSIDYEFVSVTQADGGKPRATVSSVQYDSWDSLRGALSHPGSVVVSGPLDTVSSHLGAGDFRHMGISFATDVMVTAAQNPDELRRLRTLVASLDAVVTDNYATENALIALGATPEHILRIPWGPDSLAKHSSMTRSQCGWPEDRKIVLYPRSLEPHYDPLVFVDALAVLVAQAPDVLAVFVEAGSLVDDVRHALDRHGLSGSAHFEPLREPEVFRSMMGCADVVVVTPRTDGTSVTVMDAMVLGVPVVSSLTAGSAEWVVEGITGWTFPVGDSSALASAMERALRADSAQREMMTAQAQRLVGEKAGWDSSSRRLAEVIHRFFAQH
jgi:glycosyltransferase involved in cell wall biosynthesis